MDSHTPATSHTGRLHGMPLAWLLGQDDDPLYGLGAGVVKPRHVCLVGVRSYEQEEDERLRRLGVRVIFMDEVAQPGNRRSARRGARHRDRGNQRLRREHRPRRDHAGRGAQRRHAGGRRRHQRGARARPEDVAGRPALAAIELVEYSPRLDRDGLTGRVAIDLLGAALCGPRQDAQVVAETLQR